MSPLFVSDAALIEALRSRDEKQKEYVCRTLYGSVGLQIRRWYLAKGASPGEADDWIQETFLKMLRSLEQLQGTERFVPWLWTIGRNVRLDALRVTRRHLRAVSLDERDPDDHDSAGLDVADTGLGPLEDAIRRQYLECLEQALRDFSQAFPERAEVLTWVVDGLPMAEIAVRRRKSAGTMREDLSQTRKKLRAYAAHCTES